MSILTSKGGGRPPSFFGKVLYRTSRGSMVAQKFPRQRGVRRRTLEERDSIATFDAAAAAYYMINAEEKEIVRQATQGTQWLARDLHTVLMYGTFFLLHNEEGKPIYPVAFQEEVKQSMDAIGRTTGSIMYRNNERWVGLSTKKKRHVLGIDQDGNPSWLSFNFPNGVRPLLDVYPDAIQAVSVRQLSTKYFGNCLRVRRTSDNAEKDIPFNDGYVISEQELTSFVGNSDGRVTAWYDQSGNNNDYIQTSQGKQPYIIKNGQLITEFGRPAITPETGDYLESNLSSLREKSIFIVANTIRQSSSQWAILMCSTTPGSSVGSELLIQADPGLSMRDGFSQVLYPNYTPGPTLNYCRRNASSLTDSWNSSSLASEEAVGSVINDGTYKLFDRIGTSTIREPTSISELIMYDTDKDNDRLAIDENINGVFEIF